VLLPVLAQLPQPLALLDADASAGLTLLADRCSHDYAGHHLAGSDPDAPTLRCQARGRVPLPPRIPEIAWRAGLDLSPLDVTSNDDVRWLSCLVWPGEGDREQRLAAAIDMARRAPPAVHRGDLLTGPPALAAQAPPDATLVICRGWRGSRGLPVPGQESAAAAARAAAGRASAMRPIAASSCAADRNHASYGDGGR
jgi:hypothetical protein